MFTSPAPRSPADGAAARWRPNLRACTRALGVLSVLAMSLPLSARAQEEGASAFTDIFTVPGDATVSAEQCAADTDITVGWSLDAAPAADQSIAITTNSSEECTGLIDEIQESSSFRAEDTAEVGSAALAPECPEIDGEYRFICVRLFPTDSETGISSSIGVWVDTLAPEPPDEIDTRGADGAVRIEWDWSGDAPDDLASLVVKYRPATGEGEPSEQAAAGSATSTRIEGLENDVEYELWLQAVDDVGNIGEASESVLATPRQSLGFWELYREGGGAETGGCSGAGASGGAPFALGLLGLLAAGYMLLQRRGRRGSSASLALVFVLGAAAWPTDSEARIRSDRTGDWFIELDFGPYLPEVDGEFEGEGPYQTVFGARSRIMGRLRAERALWQGYGQLGLGASIGYSRATGEALFADGTRSADTIAFAWLPISLSLTYRFDHTVREWGVPLVPYARAGLSITPWWVSGPGGIEMDAEGNSAIGARGGWFYGGGLKFLLDFIDPRLAADLRRTTGVERTYLYVDVTRMQVSGFGSEGIDLSDTTWFVGLSFEM